MTHAYTETAFDRSGFPLGTPLCAHCGHPRKTCVGEGGGGHPDYATIGRAVLVHLVGEDDHLAIRQATPELVVGRLARARDERRSLERSHALRIGRLVLDLLAEIDHARSGE